MRTKAPRSSHSRSKDPIISAYQATFQPCSLDGRDAARAEGSHPRAGRPVQHQVGIYATYHITDPKVFFAREDVWTSHGAGIAGALPTPVSPYYVLFRYPVRPTPSTSSSCLHPHGKNNLVSWMAHARRRQYDSTCPTSSQER